MSLTPERKQEIVQKLRESLDYWGRILDGEELNAPANGDIFVCDLYPKLCKDKDEPCPIWVIIGEINGKGYCCSGTPAGIWRIHQKKRHNVDYTSTKNKIYCPTCKRIARRQVKFLQWLLYGENCITKLS